MKCTSGSALVLRSKANTGFIFSFAFSVTKYLFTCVRTEEATEKLICGGLLHALHQRPPCRYFAPVCLLAFPEKETWVLAVGHLGSSFTLSSSSRSDVIFKYNADELMVTRTTGLRETKRHLLFPQTSTETDLVLGRVKHWEVRTQPTIQERKSR